LRIRAGHAHVEAPERPPAEPAPHLFIATARQGDRLAH
jgi:hypothetical protein